MSRQSAKSPIRDYLWSAGAAALSTLISIALRSELGVANAAMAYLLGVTIISAYCSRGAAILNCILSAAAFYYFCVPPYGSFTVMEYSFATTLFAMILVSLVITTLTLRVRHQSEVARRAELAVEMERTRNALLSAVSHDLKTPLVSIYGAATSILDQEERLPQPVQRALIEGIADEAGKLNRLLTNLLEMTRLDTGFELKKDWQSVEEIAGTALVRLDTVLSGRKVTVSVPHDLPLIRVDEVLMEHVLINILENAAKYTPDGSPIRIIASGDSARVKISIFDTGPGFPRGSEEKVFERFYRVNPSGVHGAGLGLAICRAIVKAHGGEIRAETRAEGGAAIHIELPTGGPLPEMDAIAEGPVR